MASSSASFCSLMAPSIRHSCTHLSLKVRAQSLRDEGRSGNIVDANLRVLRERIEEISNKEKLERCCRRTNGWNYAPGYDYKHKRELGLSQSFVLLGVVGGTFCLTTFSGTFLLCLVSLLVHLHQLIS